MITIIHKIRLLEIAAAPAFETWVETTDYAACPDLPSVRMFDVHRVSLETIAPFHYIEVIRVDSREAFEEDMRSPVFAGLVADFSKMAEVVEEVEGEQLGAGYRSP